ncbi:hypothetical protein LX64_05192 [Chitinophaga skermanii]|uniref:Uncharacterized protein n=1 Tax=Chitinophaga skermanii TaxID=331697 RepID=A0A327PXC6_9BACT|nr:hypothetical protein [Chitinophaga skermanii]RAI96970.1 hypothetical protein LX64_05192 [Chitinophaga skermanii]
METAIILDLITFVAINRQEVSLDACNLAEEYLLAYIDVTPSKDSVNLYSVNDWREKLQNVPAIAPGYTDLVRLLRRCATHGATYFILMDDNGKRFDPAAITITGWNEVVKITSVLAYRFTDQLMEKYNNSNSVINILADWAKEYFTTYGYFDDRELTIPWEDVLLQWGGHRLNRLIETGS